MWENIRQSEDYFHFSPIAKMKVDGVIATIEIPETLVKAWWDHPNFQQFIEEFTTRNPTSKTLKQQSKGKVSSSSTGVGKPVSKRPRPVDLSRFIVDSEPGDCKLVEVPLVNIRLGSGCTGMPILSVTDGGPCIRNESGKPVFGPSKGLG